MTSFTSNYETIKETSPKDNSLDLISADMTSPNPDKIQTTFFQSVRSNKFAVALVLVVLATGLMAYNVNPSSNQFRLGEYAVIVDGSKGGEFTGSKSGGITGTDCVTPRGSRAICL
mmetsp:Transcript_23295/g.23534  ORF Transcript_23295/g.23534 Transcript_23295/m.23534 type:complete len:116 (-) Transcript_23295:127-474(-)